jgi:prepilin signal peptidase PulO-like enzyme (type II secretory pathway)
MILLTLIYSFFGAVLASFLNVIISSDDSLRETLSRERSVCENCGEDLKWFELIPVLSWILQLGRCRRCKSRIPFYHLISELFLFLLFGLLFYKFTVSGDFILLISNSLFFVILYIVSMYDILKGIVPNFVTFPAIALILLVRISQFVLFDYSLSALFDYLLAGVIYFSFFVLVNFLSTRGLFPGLSERRQGFGWGDAKFSVIIGMVMGIDFTYLSWWIAVFAGAIWGAILLIRKREKNIKMPFAPFMSLGVISVILLPENVLNFFEYYLIFYDKLP